MIQAISILLATICFAPIQEREAKEESGAVKKVLLRKVFVPEKAIQQVIQGRFLPIKTEELDRLIANASRKAQDIQFKSVHLELSWDATQGLRGKCYLTLDNDLEGRQIAFDSNLEFSELTCVDSRYDFGVLGTSIDQKKILSSICGRRFECQVALPESNVLRNLKIVFPKAQLQTCSLSLPKGVTPLGKAMVRRTSTVEPDLPGSGREALVERFWVHPVNNQLSLTLVDRDQKYLVTSLDEVTTLEDRIEWRASLTGNYEVFAGRDFVLSFDKRFNCVTATQRGKKLETRVIRVGRNRKHIQLRGIEPTKQSVAISLQLESSIGIDKNLVYSPIQLGGAGTVYAKVRFVESFSWKTSILDAFNFVAEIRDSGNGIEFIQLDSPARIEIMLESEKRLPKTEVVEVDYQNGHLVVRQLLGNIEPDGMVKKDSTWEVLSAIDVQQDELPINFSELDTSGGRMLLLENENPAVWVVARRKLDSVSTYSIKDCLPVAVVNSRTRVRLEPGFVARFSQSFASPFGIRSPTQQGIEEDFNLASLGDLTFQLTADNQRFQSPFESDLNLVVGDDSLDLGYAVKWNPQTSSRILFEFNEQEIDNFVFSAKGYGTLRQLNANEKLRLGLFASRTYWAVEFQAAAAVESVALKFNLVKHLSQDGVQVELPVSIDNRRTQGTVKIRNLADNRLRIPVEKLVETGATNSEGYRVFRYSGESNLLIANAGVDSTQTMGVELQVLRCEYEIKNRNESIQTIQFVYRKDVGSFKHCLVKLDSTSVDYVSAEVGNQVIRAEKLNEGWHLMLPDSTLSQRAELRIVHRPTTQLPYWFLEVPQVEIDKQKVVEPYRISYDTGLRSINVGRWLSSDPHGNLETLLWLPTLAFDSETMNQIKNLRPLGPGLDSGSSASGLIMVKAEFYTTITLGLAMAFLAISISFRRNRSVLYSCIASLFVCFLMAEPFSFLASSAFWGFALGLVIRELKRLCTFSRGMAPSASVLLLVFLVAGDSQWVCGQSSGTSSGMPTPETSQENAKTVVPVIIPLDADDKPKDIAYLPADFYESLKTLQPLRNRLICQSTTLEISAQSNSKLVQGSCQLKVFVTETGRIRLPFFVKGAIYDSDAVTIDSRLASFQPLMEEKQVEVVFDRKGEQVLQIKFQVTGQSQPELSMNFPFSAPVSIVNRSGLDFVTSSDQSAATSQIVQSGESHKLLVEKQLRLVSVDAESMAVSIIELLDFSVSPVRRTVRIIPEATFDNNVLLTMPDNVELLNPGNGAAASGRQVSLETTGLDEVKLELVDRNLGNSGQNDLGKVAVTSHKIESYSLLVKDNRENEIRSVMSAGLSEQQLVDELSKWNRNGERLDREQIESGFMLSRAQNARFWLVPQNNDLSCFALHHFFVAADQVRVRSEWDLSSESFLRSFVVEVPEYLEVTDVSSGGKAIPFIRTAPNELCVFSNLDQAGRFLFEMNGTFLPHGSRFKVFDPRVKATVSTAKVYVWSNREKRVDAESLDRVDTRPSENGYYFVGECKDFDTELLIRDLNQFEKIHLDEEVVFVSSKSRHQVHLKLPNFSVGDWVGLDLPYDATITGEIQIGEKNVEELVVERSDTLKKKQIWIPLLNKSASDIRFDYETPLENNEVTFCEVINSRTSERTQTLPLSIADDSLDWQLNGGAIVSRTAESALFRDDQSTIALTARFAIRKQTDKALRVVMQEVVFDVDSKRLSCRFFLDPGNQTQCELEMPAGHYLESVMVCGQKRNWYRKSNRIVIPLMSNRYLQVLDVRTIPNFEPNKPSLDIEIPRVPEAKSPAVYFQCSSSMVPTECRKVDGVDLVNSRSDFLSKSISLFEINDENNPGWQAVIYSMVQSIKVSELESAELKQRLASILGSDAIPEEINELRAAAIESGFDVFQLDNDSRVRLKLNQEKTEQGPNWPFLLSIAGLGVLVTFTGRLPRWVRAPGFSMVLASLIWVFGVTWISLTPESIFAWCWILFAFLFAVLVGIDTILKLRFHRAAQITDTPSVSEANASTQLADSQNGSFSEPG